MKAIDDGGVSLLDNSMLLYTSYMADGGHGRKDYPALLAGKAAGTLRPGRHIAFRSEEHTSELQSRVDLVCRLLLEKKKQIKQLDTPQHVMTRSVLATRLQYLSTSMVYISLSSCLSSSSPCHFL